MKGLCFILVTAKQRCKYTEKPPEILITWELQHNTIIFFSATNDIKLICITMVRTHILLETYTVYLDLLLLFAFKWDYIHRQWANFNNNDKKSMNRDLEKISRSTALPLSHNTYHNIPLREQITL